MIYMLDLIMLDLHNAMFKPSEIANGVYILMKATLNNIDLSDKSSILKELRGFIEQPILDLVRNISSECLDYLLRF